MSRVTEWRITGKEEKAEAEEGRKGIRGGAPAGRTRFGGKWLESVEVLKQPHAVRFSLKPCLQLHFNCLISLF